jgi:small-conductance mechanosensitive channel
MDDRASGGAGSRVAGWLAAAAAGLASAAATAAETTTPGTGATTGPGSAGGGFWSTLVWLWDYPVFRVGERTILVSQVVTAAGVLAAGIWLVYRLRRLLHRRLTRHERFDASAVAAVERIVFYVLLVLFILLALNILQIPLTLFAFLGGALAIGLGFGAQNILNNFISGLILMFERPIRIGDLVEVNGYYGRVQEIGFRCTRIRRTDGIDMLVPNSSFLEKNVINWTLRDRRVRAVLSVGVVYGSPTAEVVRLLRQAVGENERVLEEPEPIVLFEDFGDSSLVFQVYFWTEVATAMDLREVCSRLRFRIDDLFREAGITIAFPQQDVHLDSARPVDVRLVLEGGGESGRVPGAS